MWIRTYDNKIINQSCIEQVEIKDATEIWATVTTVKETKHLSGAYVKFFSDVVKLGSYENHVETAEAYNSLWTALCIGLNHDMREEE